MQLNYALLALEDVNMSKLATKCDKLLRQAKTTPFLGNKGKKNSKSITGRKQWLKKKNFLLLWESADGRTQRKFFPLISSTQLSIMDILILVMNSCGLFYMFIINIRYVHFTKNSPGYYWGLCPVGIWENAPKLVSLF